MLRQEEQESQIVDEFEQKPPLLHRYQDSPLGHDFGVQQDQNTNSGSFQETFRPRIEETQYERIEIDTQPQDSSQSLIEDTQFESLEQVSQAFNTSISTPCVNLQGVGEEIIIASKPPQTASSTTLVPFFSKPIILDGPAEFSFSTAQHRQMQLKNPRLPQNVVPHVPPVIDATLTTAQIPVVQPSPTSTSNQTDLKSQDLVRSSDAQKKIDHQPSRPRASNREERSSTKDRLGTDQLGRGKMIPLDNSNQHKLHTFQEDVNSMKGKDLFGSQVNAVNRYQSYTELDMSPKPVENQISGYTDIPVTDKNDIVFPKSTAHETKSIIKAPPMLTQQIFVAAQEVISLPVVGSILTSKEVTDVKSQHSTHETGYENLLTEQSTVTQSENRYMDNIVPNAPSRSRRIKQPFKDVANTPSRRRHRSTSSSEIPQQVPTLLSKAKPRNPFSEMDPNSRRVRTNFKDNHASQTNHQVQELSTAIVENSQIADHNQPTKQYSQISQDSRRVVADDTVSTPESIVCNNSVGVVEAAAMVTTRLSNDENDTRIPSITEHNKSSDSLQSVNPDSSAKATEYHSDGDATTQALIKSHTTSHDENNGQNLAYPIKCLEHSDEPVANTIRNVSSPYNRISSPIHHHLSSEEEFVNGRFQSRNQSPTQFDPLLRPESRRSNQGRSITRPLQSKILEREGVSEGNILGATSPSKVKKSRPAIANSTVSTLQNFVALGEKYAALEKECQEQAAHIEKQTKELQQLKGIDEESKKTIKNLELEKKAWTEKLDKFTELATKYKNHANEIIRTQRFLKAEGGGIQKKTEGLKKEIEKDRADADAKLREIGKEVTSAMESTQGFLVKLAAAKKDMNIVIETNKNLIARNQALENEKKMFESRVLALQCANEHLASSKKELDASREELETAERKRYQDRYQMLQFEAKKADETNNQLLIDNQKIHEQLMSALKTNQLLEDTIDKQLMGLSKEGFKIEKLQKEVEVQNNCHKELVKLLKQVPVDIASKFMEDEGLLARIIDAENVTQAKVEQVTSLIDELKNHGLEPPVSLVKLIEDLFSRLEKTSPAVVDADSTHEDPAIILLESLKESISQLRLDKEVEIRLNNNILELRQNNHTLTNDKSALESELQKTSTQLAELKYDLSACRSDLNIRTEELAAAQALPREDPKLQAKIQDLQNKNNTMENQLEDSNQKISNLKEELNFSKEMSSRQQQQLKELEKKLLDSQARIKGFDDEKTNYMAQKEQENKIYCHELTKKAENSKGSLKRKLDSEIKNLEQKNRDTDTELKSVKKELQKRIDTDGTYGKTITNLETELNAYKEQFAHQVTQLQYLEDHAHTNESPDDIAAKIQTAHREISELRALLQSSKTDASHSIEESNTERRSLEESLRKFSLLLQDKEKVEMENASLKESLENLKESSGRQNHFGLGQVNGHAFAHGTTTITVTRPLPIASLSKQQQSQSPNSTWDNTQPGLENNGTLPLDVIEAPQYALRNAIRHVASSKIAYAPNGNIEAQDVRPRVSNSGIQDDHNSGSCIDDSNEPMPVQNITSDSRRQLRPAQRKHSRLGSLEDPKYIDNMTELLPSYQQPLQSRAKNLPLSGDAFMDSETTISENQTYSRAPEDRSSSSLTDYESLVNMLPSANNEEQLQAVYEKARGSKARSNRNSYLGSKGKVSNARVKSGSLRGISQPESHSEDNATLYNLPSGNEDDDKPPTKRVKLPAKTLSTSEESQRRRISKPVKSAMKRTTQVLDDNDIYSQNGAVSFDSVASSISRQTGNAGRGERKNTGRQLPGPNSFKGVVGGKVTKASNGASRIGTKGATAQNRTPSKRPSGSQQSPILQVARRGSKVSSRQPSDSISDV